MVPKDKQINNSGITYSQICDMRKISGITYSQICDTRIIINKNYKNINV